MQVLIRELDNVIEVAKDKANAPSPESPLNLLIVVFLFSFINQSKKPRSFFSFFQSEWKKTVFCAWALSEAQRNRNIIIFMVILSFRCLIRVCIFIATVGLRAKES